MDGLARYLLVLWLGCVTIAVAVLLIFPSGPASSPPSIREPATWCVKHHQFLIVKPNQYPYCWSR